MRTITSQHSSAILKSTNFDTKPTTQLEVDAFMTQYEVNFNSSLCSRKHN